MSLHIIRIEQGNVTQPAQPNMNPSVAESPTQARGQSPVGVGIKAAVFVQAGQQIMNNTISNIGYATGNYELQEKAETLVKVAGLGVGLVAAPLATGIALTISTAFEVYKTNVEQQRNQYKQLQEQVFTGKIVTNRGVYV